IGRMRRRRSQYHRLRPTGGGLWRNKSRWRVDDDRNTRPTSPVPARLPAPSKSRNKGPCAIPVWQPAPWIHRNPAISKSRIVAPRAVRKWTPRRPDSVGLPHPPISRNVVVVAVIIQIAPAISDRRLIRRSRTRVLMLKFALVFVPLVERLGRYALGHGGGVIRQLKRRGLILRDFYRARRVLHVNVTFGDGQLHLILRYVNPKICRFRHIHRLAPKIRLKVVLLVFADHEIDSALTYIDRTCLHARIPQRELRK